MHEELRSIFQTKVFDLIKSTEYEKRAKYHENVTQFKDIEKAKKLNLYDLSPDCRRIYKSLIKDIEGLKGTATKEVNYLFKINEILKERREFLLEEIEDDNGTEEIEKSLIDAHEYITKLAFIYMELYRIWVHVVEGFNNLNKIHVHKMQLDDTMKRQISRFSQETIFRNQYILADK
jgi:hypothetical protein